MAAYIGLARILLLLAVIASLLSLGGGGLALPPFKSTPWLKTATSNVGLYGACLAPADQSFFSVDADWLALEAQCTTIFVQNGNSVVGACILI